MPIDPASYIQVFRVDLPPDKAAEMANDPAALEAALGVVPDLDKLHLIDPKALADIGLSGYLAEGEGAKAEAVAVDKTRLDMVRTPVLLLLPGATRPDDALVVRDPLVHLGDYPLEEARPADGDLLTPSAEGLIAGTPPRPVKTVNDKRVSGMVAMVALAVAFLVAFVMYLVAS
ncbi:hypothetical protein ILP92_01245 [Maribius pontilimi]|uniref:Uncharacterized protein n=1 Tax=Palleronia pontilimi TaxID=1964209 RepID=A0A934IBE8_9RHOB|nr:hypothetical protein [Palleronia pontilimi]MBJ3761377.1 hypothetical protein [Palleronia pontilimi]